MCKDSFYLHDFGKLSSKCKEGTLILHRLHTVFIKPSPTRV